MDRAVKEALIGVYNIQPVELTGFPSEKKKKKNELNSTASRQSTVACGIVNNHYIMRFHFAQLAFPGLVRVNIKQDCPSRANSRQL